MRIRSIVIAGVLAAATGALAGCGSSHRPVTTGPGPSPPQPVKFLHGGIRTLAQGTFPDHRRFSIFSQHYRFSGRTYLDLSVAMRSGAGSGFTPAQAPGPIAFGDFGDCSHPSVLLLYAVLRARRDHVTLSSRRVTHQLARAPIPASLHAGGRLVYGLTDTPATLTVRSPAGRVLETLRIPGPGSVKRCASGQGSFSTQLVPR